MAQEELASSGEQFLTVMGKALEGLQRQGTSLDGVTTHTKGRFRYPLSGGFVLIFRLDVSEDAGGNPVIEISLLTLERLSPR